MENKLSHFDINGNAVMVDVSNKNDTDRVAVAHGFIKLSKEAFEEETVDYNYIKSLLRRRSSSGVC